MADEDNLIITAVGPDKIGLVEKISEYVLRYGCNIEDSRMAVFCGEFALILLIAGESGKLVKLAANYNELAAQTGLTVWLKTPSKKKSAESSLPYRLTASCMDHPGVVHKLSALLSQHGVNIDAMETKTYAAPVSGTPIFRLEAVVSVPAKLPIGVLRERFAEVAKAENIDIELAAS